MVMGEWDLLSNLMRTLLKGIRENLLFYWDVGVVSLYEVVCVLNSVCMVFFRCSTF